MRETIKCGKYPRWFHCWFEVFCFFWWHNLVFIVFELSCGLLFFCIFLFESSHLRHDSMIDLCDSFIRMSGIQPSCMCSCGERCSFNTVVLSAADLQYLHAWIGWIGSDFSISVLFLCSSLFLGFFSPCRLLTFCCSELCSVSSC